MESFTEMLGPMVDTEEWLMYFGRGVGEGQEGVKRISSFKRDLKRALL